MSNLFAVAFRDEQGAARTLKEVESLQKQKLIMVEDAAVVVHPRDGKVKVKQAANLTSAGAVGGAFWGMLLGLIFLVPVAGLAIGATAGAVMGRFRDYGIDDDFIKKVSKSVTPGTSALFLLINSVQKEKVLKALRPYGGSLIQSSLSPAAETRLKKAMVA